MAETLYVLRYEYVPDIAEARAPYRAEHLELIGTAHAAGDIVLAGAVGDPPAWGLLIFRAAAAAEAFAAGDPYVKSGIVTAWTVEPWTVVT